MGLVPEVFSGESGILSRLTGDMSIGHVRYSTTGGSNIINAQPFTASPTGATASPSPITATSPTPGRSAAAWKPAAPSSSPPPTPRWSSISWPGTGGLTGGNLVNAGDVRGAYSLVIFTADQLVAVRDPYGFRPLFLGQVNGAWVVASETCALDLVEAKYIPRR